MTHCEKVGENVVLALVNMVIPLGIPVRNKFPVCEVHSFIVAIYIFII